jgi:hypothetical protein
MVAIDRIHFWISHSEKLERYSTSRPTTYMVAQLKDIKQLLDAKYPVFYPDPAFIIALKVCSPTMVLPLQVRTLLEECGLSHFAMPPSTLPPHLVSPSGPIPARHTAQDPDVPRQKANKPEKELGKKNGKAVEKDRKKRSSVENEKSNDKPEKRSRRAMAVACPVNESLRE